MGTMKYVLATTVLLLAWLAHAEAQEPSVKGMSAIDIAEALTSPTHSVRERGAKELALMDAETARELGSEIQRLGVREAEICLKAIGRADFDNAAQTLCVVLDSREYELRAAALDALIGMHPSKVADNCDKLLRARKAILRKMITDDDYLKHLAEGVKTGEKGILVKPVERAMALMILYDRHFGVEAMSMVLGRFAGFLLGEEDAAKLSPVQRYLGERRRRGAATWLETIWIVDPAIQFNYSPTAPYKDRQAAVARLSAKLEEMQKAEFSSKRDRTATLTGMRYGDYLTDLYNSDLSEHEAAAYLRVQWWSGEDVEIAGDGYAEAVDTFNAMSSRQKRRRRAPLYKFWYDYREATDIK